jgi:hypothetical protein
MVGVEVEAKAVRLGSNYPETMRTIHAVTN